LKITILPGSTWNDFLAAAECGGLLRKGDYTLNAMRKKCPRGFVATGLSKGAYRTNNRLSSGVGGKRRISSMRGGPELSNLRQKTLGGLGKRKGGIERVVGSEL